MICNNCSQVIADNASFCRHCGKPVARQSESLVCEKCGTQYPAGSKFCKKDGTLLQSLDEASSAADRPVDETQTVAEMPSSAGNPEKGLICVTCGSIYPLTVKFCKKDGSALQAEASNAVAEAQPEADIKCAVAQAAEPIAETKSCPKCGVQYPLSTKFCKKDGASLLVLAIEQRVVDRLVAADPETPSSGGNPEERLICATCGTSYPPTVKFCKKDGFALQAASSNVVTEAEVKAGTPGAVAQAAEAVAETKSCPKCGAQYPLSTKFCKKDGTPLHNMIVNGDGTDNEGVGEAEASSVDPPACEKGVDCLVCPKCGKQYPLMAKFCKADGTPLQPLVAEQAAVGKSKEGVRASEAASLSTGQSGDGLVCGQCGTSYPPTVKFCKKDGSTLQAALSPVVADVSVVAEDADAKVPVEGLQVETVPCPKCGILYPLSTKFCKKDGTSLQSQEASRNESPSASSSVLPAVEVSLPITTAEEIVCAKCGAKYPPTAKFCLNDGTPLQSAESVVAVAPLLKPEVASVKVSRSAVSVNLQDHEGERRQGNRAVVAVVLGLITVSVLAGAGYFVLYKKSVAETQPVSSAEPATTPESNSRQTPPVDVAPAIMERPAKPRTPVTSQRTARSAAKANSNLVTEESRERPADLLLRIKQEIKAPSVSVEVSGNYDVIIKGTIKGLAEKERILGIIRRQPSVNKIIDKLFVVFE